MKINGAAFPRSRDSALRPERAKRAWGFPRRRRRRLPGRASVGY